MLELQSDQHSVSGGLLSRKKKKGIQSTQLKSKLTDNFINN